jgi:hypothetical protein
VLRFLTYPFTKFRASVHRHDTSLYYNTVSRGRKFKDFRKLSRAIPHRTSNKQRRVVK